MTRGGEISRLLMCRDWSVFVGTVRFAEGGGPGLQLRTTANPQIYLLFQLATFVPVDVAEGFVIMCNYTGKEVV
jgi:hypothetical protein